MDCSIASLGKVGDLWVLAGGIQEKWPTCPDDGKFTYSWSMRASAALLLLLLPASASAQLTCGDAIVDARSLHYCTGGTGSDVVVFESPIGAGASAWDSTAALIARYARVVTWDRAGTGGSPAAGGTRAPSDVAAELRLLLNRLGHREPVVLVAHRDGAWFARAFARLYPDRVRALVLIDPPHEGFEARARAFLTPAEQAARDSSIAARVAALPDAARQEFNALGGSPPGDLAEVPLIVIGVGRHDWTPRERSGELEALTHELETALAGRVRDGRTQLVAAAGPDLPQSHPAVIADAVREVINRSDQGFQLSRDVVMWVIGLAITVLFGVLAWRQGRVGAEFNKIQIAKAEAERQAAEAARAKAAAVVPNPHEIDFFELVPRGTPPSQLATALLRATNEKAAALFQQHLRGGSSNERADRMWGRTWDDGDWNAQRAWVEPWDTGPGRASTLVQDVLTMLRGDEKRVWITAPAGAGKSTFMNRLFFEAIGVAGHTKGTETGPVPMFVQPRNVGAQGIQRLREAERMLPVFLEGWLANRGITVPEESRAALVANFERALEAGDIVLFLDGYDELVDLGLTAFLGNLLSHARSYVCAERSDRRVSRSGASLSLPPTWTMENIREHLKARWPNRSDWTPRVHEHLRKETDGDHILRVPRYLDLFLRRLEQGKRLPEESELRELSRGGPELAADIVALALERLPPDPAVKEHELNARLFQVAAARVLQADFVLPEKNRDTTWNRILQMTEFVSDVLTPQGDHNVRITHPALVDYFLAGHIASEIRIGASSVTQGDRHWSRGLLAGVSAWLRKSADPALAREIWRRIRSAEDEEPVTNLLELVVQLDLDRQRTHRRNASESDRRRNVRIEGQDLSGRNIQSAELRLVTFERCRFSGADLREADLQHVTFHDCLFVGAKLSGANALGAEFARCQFLDPADPTLLPAMRGMQIEAAEFHEGTGAASDVGAAWLVANGASQTRTRYGAEFGRIFFNRQAAFLGPGATTLERGAYRERIEAALARCQPRQTITVVDLMAGGGNEWLAALVAPGTAGAPRFPGLRVLGIDRDEPQLRELKRKFPDVFKWHRLEIGASGVNLPAIVRDVFGGNGQHVAADVVVAKKAIHELRQPVQSRLIAQCFDGLRPGGELVLFADSPGPVEPASHAMSAAEFARIDSEIRALLLDVDTPLSTIREAIVNGISLGGSHADQARFCNLWVLVKDWANDNLHEVRNRWFSSAAEIRWWAKAAGFTESAPPAEARYRIAVARFNERGIQRVVHHLERNGPSVISTDGSMLADWLSAHGDERQALLLEFTAHHLVQGSELARAVRMEPVATDWGLIHEDLRRLEGVGGETISFEFPVHVLSFRKAERREDEVTEGRKG